MSKFEVRYPKRDVNTFMADALMLLNAIMAEQIGSAGVGEMSFRSISASTKQCAWSGLVDKPAFSDGVTWQNQDTIYCFKIDHHFM